MAAHLNERGMLLIEPWFSSAAWNAGAAHVLVVDRPDLKAARMAMAGREGDVSILDFHYLVAGAGEVRYFTEHHELGLFSQEDYIQACSAAGLEARIDSPGLTGRDLLVAHAH